MGNAPAMRCPSSETRCREKRGTLPATLPSVSSHKQENEPGHRQDNNPVMSATDTQRYPNHPRHFGKGVIPLVDEDCASQQIRWVRIEQVTQMDERYAVCAGWRRTTHRFLCCITIDEHRPARAGSHRTAQAMRALQDGAGAASAVEITKSWRSSSAQCSDTRFRDKIATKRCAEAVGMRVADGVIVCRVAPRAGQSNRPKGTF